MTDATKLRERLTALRLSQRGLGRSLSVNERTVRDWASGASPVPEHVWRWLRDAIAPPPVGSTDADDRDEACVMALEPHVARLIERAREAGWHEAEALCAVMAIATDRMRGAGGDAETRAILQSLILQLDE